MIYAGIGSRKTPPEIIEIFERMGSWLAKKGHILRSGGAEGADSAFEKGCDKESGEKEIYLPWIKFNHNPSRLVLQSLNAEQIARNYHPAFERLSDSAKKLVIRDVYQILGRDCESSFSDFVICYTPKGKWTGGTSQALRIARAYNIPVFNAGNYEKDDLTFDTEKLIQDFNIFYKTVKKQKEALEENKEMTYK